MPIGVRPGGVRSRKVRAVKTFQKQKPDGDFRVAVQRLPSVPTAPITLQSAKIKFRSNLSSSRRTASAAVNKAIAGLPPNQQSLVSDLKGGAVVARGKPGSGLVAVASNPIKFFARGAGELRTDVDTTARHEVAHHLLDASRPAETPRDVEREHFTIRTSRAVRSQTDLRQVTAIQRLSPSRRQQRALKTRGLGSLKFKRRLSKVGKISLNDGHPRFSREQNRNVEASPRSSTSTVSRAREQARKSGIRVKRKGVDF